MGINNNLLATTGSREIHRHANCSIKGLKSHGIRHKCFLKLLRQTRKGLSWGDKRMEKECCRYGKLRVLELPILPPRWQGKGLVIGRGKDVAGCRASEEALRKAHEKLEERLRKHAFSIVRLNDRLRRKIEEHKRIEDKLRESNHRLKIAYEQAITYAKALNEEIAERRHTEKALRESEARYRSFVRNFQGIAYWGDGHGAPLFLHGAVQEITGYAGKEIICRDPAWSKIIHPDDLAEVQQSTETILSFENHAAEREYRIVSKDGTVRWVHEFVQNVGPGPDRSVMIQGVVYDITERKLAEQELRRSREQFRNLSSYLQNAREQERARIARDMHDVLGQSFMALKMDLSWLAKKLPQDKQHLKTKIDTMTDFIDLNIHNIQRLCSDLRPGILDDLGITAAIEWQAREFEKRTGIPCRITAYPRDMVLDKGRSTAIFRIFQEALTNIVRHADAKKVRVSLTRRHDEVVLKVSDNGKGISAEHIDSAKSLGLIGIRERALTFGGDVTISGEQGAGTTVSVNIPLGE